MGRFLGPDALAAVGSAYTLMTFLTSILIGMAMGSGALQSFILSSSARLSLFFYFIDICQVHPRYIQNRFQRKVLLFQFGVCLAGRRRPA